MAEQTAEKPALGRGQDQVTPAWMTRSNQGKRVRLCAFRVLLGRKAHKPMPVAVRNGLPSMLIPMLGSDVDLLVLVDTCAAVSVGNLDTHKDWIRCFPEMVEEFREFNGNDPFEPIKLGGAINDPSLFDDKEVEEEYGALTVVVRYRTNLFFPDGARLIHSFALGKDVAVSTIMGWPTIKDINLVISPQKMTGYSSKLRREFQLIRHDTVECERRHSQNTIKSASSNDRQQAPTSGCDKHIDTTESSAAGPVDGERRGNTITQTTFVGSGINNATPHDATEKSSLAKVETATEP